MAERTDQRSRSDPSREDPTVDIDTGREPERSQEAKRTGLRDRLTSPLAGLFSLRTFLVVLGLTLVATVGAGTLLPLGGLAGLFGIAAVGFGLGLVDTTPRYLELLVAGAVAAGLGTVFDHLVLTMLGVGLPLIALGVGAGGLAGVVGHYFGRDLRVGLTKDL